MTTPITKSLRVDYPFTVSDPNGIRAAAKLAEIEAERDTLRTQLAQALADAKLAWASNATALLNNDALRAERDEARRHNENMRADMQVISANHDDLKAERHELSRLAEQAQRGATIEERQLAATLVCARLVRPATDHQHERDDESCAACCRENGGAQ